MAESDSDFAPLQDLNRCISMGTVLGADGRVRKTLLVIGTNFEDAFPQVPQGFKVESCGRQTVEGSGLTLDFTVYVENHTA